MLGFPRYGIGGWWMKIGNITFDENLMKGVVFVSQTDPHDWDFLDDMCPPASPAGSVIGGLFMCERFLASPSDMEYIKRLIVGAK